MLLEDILAIVLVMVWLIGFPIYFYIYLPHKNNKKCKFDYSKTISARDIPFLDE